MKCYECQKKIGEVGELIPHFWGDKIVRITCSKNTLHEWQVTEVAWEAFQEGKILTLDLDGEEINDKI